MGEEKWALSLEDIEPKPRKWLWPNRIPAGEITLIAGTQGLGKSILVTDVASHITTGKPWPDNTKCSEGTVIILPAEDNLASTVVPRYKAAGANLGNVVVVRGAPDAKRKGKLKQFDIGAHFDRLVYLVKNTKSPKVVIIDPLGSYVGNIDVHRENSVRSVMYPLRAEVAEKYNVAVIGIVHLKKGGADESALSRILGSVAFTAFARTVWGVGQDTEDASRRLFVPIKYNLAKRTIAGLEFFIVDGYNKEGIVKWGEEITELAEDVMVDRGMKPERQREKAKKLIIEKLKKGPQPAADITEYLIQHDIGLRTVKTAKKELGIKSIKMPNGKWMWIPPKWKRSK